MAQPVSQPEAIHIFGAIEVHNPSLLHFGYLSINICVDPTASHLSLAEEARNTERHQSWHTDLKLRHTQVSFVSAGTLEDTVDHDLPRRVFKAGEVTTGEVPPDPEQLLASMTVNKEDLCNHNLCHVDRGKESDVCYNHNNPPSGTTISTVTVYRGNDIFIVDTKGSTQNVESGMPPPTMRRSLSPLSSNSSEEVVVFRGRNRSRQGRGASFSHQTGRQQERQAINADLEFKDLSYSTNQEVGKPRNPRLNSSSAERKAVRSIERVGGPTFKADPSIGSNTRPQSRSARGSMRRELDGVMKDDIQKMHINLKENCNRTESNFFSLQEARDSNDDIWQAKTEASLTKEAISNSKNGCTDEDLAEFEDLSTSSDIPEAIVNILSRRQRPSGVQYLVVCAGDDSDSARWVPRSSLKKIGSPELISLFHFNEKECANPSAVSSGSDYEALRILDLDETEGTRGEDNLIEGKKARMTDEQIALRWAKKEQLGFGSSEVMLSAGDEVEDWSDEEDINRLLQMAREYSRTKVIMRERKGNAPASARSFADALIQDPYGGFDVMDQERPSLRSRAKGRRCVLPLELSDSELEASVLLAWENDRTKKKIQKQERATLRAQGLLNRKSKADMKAKYSEGMTIVSFKEEIRDFLNSKETRYNFFDSDKVNTDAR